MAWYKYNTSRWSEQWSYIEGPKPTEMKRIYGETDGGFVEFAHNRGIINQYNGYFIEWCFVPRPPVAVVEKEIKKVKDKIAYLRKREKNLKEQLKKR